MSVSVSGASVVAVLLFAVLFRQRPFGSDTTPGRTHVPSCRPQRTSPSSLKTRTSSPSSSPREAASAGCISELHRRSRQLAERRADGAIARRRNERQRIRQRGGIGLVPVQPERRLAFERLREQVHLAVGGLREHVHELHGHAVPGLVGRAALLEAARRCLAEGRRARARSRSSSPRGLAVPQQAPCGRDELAEHIGVRPCLADRIDDRPAKLQRQRAVGSRDVIAFQERRRRQHDIGIQAACP